MFFITQDEIEANCTEPREDPMRTALPYDEETGFEFKIGKELVGGVDIATPLAIAEGLKDVYDPEIPVNVYDLGLIYDIGISDKGDVSILLTLTSPNCPVAGDLPGWIGEAASAVPGTGRVGVKLTFDPPWVPDYMNELAKVATGIW